MPKKWHLVFFIILLTLTVICQKTVAHQTPNTVVLMDINPTKVAVELQLPLSELELAFGHDITKNPETLVQRLEPQLKEYILAHIHTSTAKDQNWLIEITDMKVEKTEQLASGSPFQEIIVHLLMTPPAGRSTRKFIFEYDVIMHQVLTHIALVSIRNDWEQGKMDDKPVETGFISVDIRDKVIYPLTINLENNKESWWKGFKSMVFLGMQHIKEGTDHLLFIIVLLLPAMLLVNGKRWGNFGGVKYSFIHVLKIVTAFTVGHSITLLIGALGWLSLPVQPVEVLIAFSILVSAIHAIRPIFAGKETYIAAGFGLLHGLAFATVLSNLHLGAGAMALSILGFNIGIELMQLFVITLIIPGLILLSQTPIYTIFRIIGAVLASIIAIAWIFERTSGKSNYITNFVANMMA